jgi:hypothetical protein
MPATPPLCGPRPRQLPVGAGHARDSSAARAMPATAPPVGAGHARDIYGWSTRIEPEAPSRSLPPRHIPVPGLPHPGNRSRRFPG